MQNRSCYLLEHQWKETQYNVAKKQEEGNYLKKNLNSVEDYLVN